MQRHPTGRPLLWHLLIVPTLMIGAAPASAQIRVVTSLPTYAAITREITGDLAVVDAIARGDEDAHFVKPRPSFAALIQRADLFISTGLDLELWVPALLDRANNSRVVPGGPGNVVAYAGVALRDIPENVSRAGGDIHVFGNPHIHTDPVNAIVVARNILSKLVELDPVNAGSYEDNAATFETRVMERTFGAEIIELLGHETIFDLARTYEFWDFAETQQYQGRPLVDYLGGWLAESAVFRNRDMVCYHKNWAYLSARFRVNCAMFVEPKPGIPPSPGHVRRVIQYIEENDIPVIFAANYFSRTQVERVASRTGARALVVPEHVGGADGVDDYFSLMDRWVESLTSAFRTATSAHPE